MPEKKRSLYAVHLTSYTSLEAKEKVDRNLTILADELKSECFYCDYSERKAAFILYQVAIQASNDPLAKTLVMTKDHEYVVQLHLHRYPKIFD